MRKSRRKSVFGLSAGDRLVLLLVVTLALVTWAWSGGMSWLRDLTGLGGTGAVPDTPVSQALEELSTVQEPWPTYAREEFGPAWADEDHNGCDTRNDILLRDLSDATLAPDGCRVTSGLLNDPYTGESVEFVRGQGTSEAVQIDHVVALSDAWRSGAWQWDGRQRQQFANDPLNLLAVDGPANQEKGSSDADQWLPPNQEAECDYVVRQITVKTTYQLSVTVAERDAMRRVLTDCGTVDLAERVSSHGS